MHLCIYASEVAAAIGQNQYKHPVEVLLAAWKRYHQGQEFELAQARMASLHSLDADTMGDHADVISKAIEKTPALKHTVEAWEKKVASTPLPVVMSGCLPEIKIALEKERTKCAETPALRNTASGTLLGLNTSAAVSVSEQDISAYIQSRLSQTYGQQREKQSLHRMPDVKENNSSFFRTEVGDFTLGSAHIRYSIGGRIDGLVGKKLIEIKNRKQRFLTPLPQYDVIQMHCYMKLLDVKEGELVEHLSSGSEKKTTVKWSETLWNKISSGLLAFSRILAKLILTEGWQDRLLEAKTREEQRAVYFALNRAVNGDE